LHYTGFFNGKIGDRVCLKGNVVLFKFIRFGKPEDVKNKVKRQVEATKKSGGYIVSTGGKMGYRTLYENMFAVVEAVEEYGKY